MALTPGPDLTIGRLNTMKDDDLLRELQRLPKELTPPPQVRNAVAREVRARHHRDRTSSYWRMAIAASLVGGAFLLGRWSVPVAGPAPAREFALLLYGGESDATAGARVTEYVAWARRMRQDGRAIRGERLGDESWTVGETALPQVLRGFFIVEAGDAEDAQTLARAHPHTKYGGAIVIRPVGAGR